MASLHWAYLYSLNFAPKMLHLHFNSRLHWRYLSQYSHHLEFSFSSWIRCYTHPGQRHNFDQDRHLKNRAHHFYAEQCFQSLFWFWVLCFAWFCNWSQSELKRHLSIVASPVLVPGHKLKPSSWSWDLRVTLLNLVLALRSCSILQRLILFHSFCPWSLL